MALQQKLEDEVKQMRALQTELSNNQNTRAQFMAQLKENELVKQGIFKINIYPLTTSKSSS